MMGKVIRVKPCLLTKLNSFGIWSFMVRPLRIEYPGAWYHVTSRGNEKKNIFSDDQDKKGSLRFYQKPAISMELRRMLMYSWKTISIN